MENKAVKSNRTKWVPVKLSGVHVEFPDGTSGFYNLNQCRLTFRGCFIPTSAIEIVVPDDGSTETLMD